MFSKEVVTSISISLGRSPEEQQEIKTREAGLVEAFCHLRGRQLEITKDNDCHLSLKNLHRILRCMSTLTTSVSTISDIRSNMQSIAQVSTDEYQLLCGDGVTRSYSRKQLQDLMHKSCELAAKSLVELADITERIPFFSGDQKTIAFASTINQLIKSSTSEVESSSHIASHTNLDRIKKAIFCDEGINDCVKSLRNLTYTRYARYLEIRQEHLESFYETSYEKHGFDLDVGLGKEDDEDSEESTVNPMIQRALLAQLQIAEVILTEQDRSKDNEQTIEFLKRDILTHLRGTSSVIGRVPVEGLLSFLEHTCPIVVSMLVHARSIDGKDEAVNDWIEAINHRTKLILGVSEGNFELEEQVLAAPTRPTYSLPEVVIDSLMQKILFVETPKDIDNFQTLIESATNTDGLTLKSVVQPKKPSTSTVITPVDSTEAKDEVVKIEEGPIATSIQMPVAQKTEPTVVIEPLGKQQASTVIVEQAVGVDEVQEAKKLAYQTLSMLTGLDKNIFISIDDGVLTDDIILDRIGAFESTIGMDIGNLLINTNYELLTDPVLLQETIDIAQRRLTSLKNLGDFEQLGLAVISSYSEILLSDEDEHVIYLEKLGRVWRLLNSGDFSNEAKSKYSPWAQPDKWASVSDLEELRVTLLEVRDGPTQQTIQDQKVDNIQRDENFVRRLIEEGWDQSQAKNAVAILLYAFRGYPKLPEGALYRRSPERLKVQGTFHKTCVELKSKNALLQPSTGRSEMYIVNVTDGIKSQVLAEIIALYKSNAFKRD